MVFEFTNYSLLCVFRDQFHKWEVSNLNMEIRHLGGILVLFNVVFFYKELRVLHHDQLANRITHLLGRQGSGL